MLLVFLFELAAELQVLSLSHLLLNMLFFARSMFTIMDGLICYFASLKGKKLVDDFYARVLCMMLQLLLIENLVKLSRGKL